MSPSPFVPAFVERSSAHIRLRLRAWLFSGAHLLLVWLLLCPDAARCDPGSVALSDLARWQRQALRHAGLDRRSHRELMVRLRLATLLPQVRATWGRGTQWVYSSRGDLLNEAVPDGDRSSYSVSASWDLSRLLWSPDDLALHRLAPRVASDRQQILTQVAALYLQLCRRQQAHDGPPAQPTGASSEHTPALQIALLALLGEEADSSRVPHCPEQIPDDAALLSREPRRTSATQDSMQGQSREAASDRLYEP